MRDTRLLQKYVALVKKQTERDHKSLGSATCSTSLGFNLKHCMHLLMTAETVVRSPTGQYLCRPGGNKVCAPA